MVLLNYKEIMKRLSCSKSYAYQLLHMFMVHGKSVRIGNMLRVEEKVFDEWLNAVKEGKEWN